MTTNNQEITPQVVNGQTTQTSGGETVWQTPEGLTTANASRPQPTEAEADAQTAENFKNASR